MDIKTVQINLKNLMNKWFYTREQIHELLEQYVTVNNQGILNVGLPSAEKITLTTNNNAITTADVANFTATVKDNSNNPAYGVPVQFVNRTTREVLYDGTTDENGECDFHYFSEEAEILPVQARISNDYIFKDEGRLNSHNNWSSSTNVTLERHATHSIISRTNTSSPGMLTSPSLNGICDVDFKVKIPSDGSTNGAFCQVQGNSSNSFTLNDLNLTTDKWYNFHISVLDDRIVVYCKDNGKTKTRWVDGITNNNYYFKFIPNDVPTIMFSDLKITRCSDDLSMFIKDKNIEYISWDIGVLTNYTNIWSTSTTSNNIVVTRTSDYTEFKEASSSNFGNSTTGLTDSCIIEFDYWQLGGLTNTFMQIAKNGTQVTDGGMNLNMLNGNLESWYHLKLTIQNGILTVLNETNGTLFTKILNDTPNTFTFWSSGEVSAIRFKNFIIYKR